MDELMPVGTGKIDGRMVQTVNSRDLHAFLGVQSRHSEWIMRRIEEYVFAINSDFCTILSKSQGGRPEMIYHLSLDMAKELCMIERGYAPSELYTHVRTYPRRVLREYFDVEAA